MDATTNKAVTKYQDLKEPSDSTDINEDKADIIQIPVHIEDIDRFYAKEGVEISTNYLQSFDMKRRFKEMGINASYSYKDKEPKSLETGNHFLRELHEERLRNKELKSSCELRPQPRTTSTVPRREFEASSELSPGSKTLSSIEKKELKTLPKLALGPKTLSTVPNTTSMNSAGEAFTQTLVAPSQKEDICVTEGAQSESSFEDFNFELERSSKSVTVEGNNTYNINDTKTKLGSSVETTSTFFDYPYCFRFISNDVTEIFRISLHDTHLISKSDEVMDKDDSHRDLMCFSPINEENNSIDQPPRTIYIDETVPVCNNLIDLSEEEDHLTHDADLQLSQEVEIPSSCLSFLENAAVSTEQSASSTYTSLITSRQEHVSILKVLQDDFVEMRSENNFDQLSNTMSAVIQCFENMIVTNYTRHYGTDELLEAIADKTKESKEVNELIDSLSDEEMKEEIRDTTLYDLDQELDHLNCELMEKQIENVIDYCSA